MKRGTSIYLDSELKARIDSLAKSENRSFGSMTCILLQEAVETRDSLEEVDGEGEL